MEPPVVVGESVDANDHRGLRVSRLEDLSQPRDMPPTVTGEDDRLDRHRRDVHRDLATTVVLERLGDELSSCGRHWRWLLVNGGGLLLRRARGRPPHLLTAWPSGGRTPNRPAPGLPTVSGTGG